MKSKFILFASAVLASATAFAQSSVSTNGSKYVLLEEATGHWCGYCPDGASIVEDTKTAYPKCIAVSIHGYTGTQDAMIIADGDAVWSARPMDVKSGPYTSADSTPYFCSGYPNGCIDRALVSRNRGQWKTDVGGRVSMTPKVDITLTHTYNPSTGVLSITVSAKTLAALTGSYNINAYIVEDSIASESNQSTYYQHSYYYNDANSPWYHKGTLLSGSTYGLSSSVDKYWHNNVLRAMLGGSWGTTGIIANNAAAGNTYSKTYTYTIPSSQKVNHMRIVGLVQQYTANDLSKRVIENAVQAKVSFSTTVGEVANISNLDIYPNPATDVLHIKGDFTTPAATTIHVANMLGQNVITKEIKANGTSLDETVSLAGLQNGIYMVSVTSNGSTAVKKVIVNN